MHIERFVDLTSIRVYRKVDICRANLRNERWRRRWRWLRLPNIHTGFIYIYIYMYVGYRRDQTRRSLAKETNSAFLKFESVDGFDEFCFDFFLMNRNLKGLEKNILKLIWWLKYEKVPSLCNITNYSRIYFDYSKTTYFELHVKNKLLVSICLVWFRKLSLDF